MRPRAVMSIRRRAPLRLRACARALRCRRSRTRSPRRRRGGRSRRSSPCDRDALGSSMRAGSGNSSCCGLTTISIERGLRTLRRGVEAADGFDDVADELEARSDSLRTPDRDRRRRRARRTRRVRRRDLPARTPRAPAARSAPAATPSVPGAMTRPAPASRSGALSRGTSARADATTRRAAPEAIACKARARRRDLEMRRQSAVGSRLPAMAAAIRAR